MIGNLFELFSAIFKWLKSIADPIQKWATTIALIVGAVWTYQMFVREDAHEKNLEISVSLQSLPYSTDSRLLIAHVGIKNIGKVPIEIPAGQFWVEVKMVPTEAKRGYLNVGKLPILYRADDIAVTGKEYWLEPGVKYDEVRAFIVGPGTYAVKAEADYEDEQEVDETQIYQVN